MVAIEYEYFKAERDQTYAECSVCGAIVLLHSEGKHTEWHRRSALGQIRRAPDFSVADES